MFTPEQFVDLIFKCADAPTPEERIAADRALTLDAVERIHTSGWGYSSDGDKSQISGGPQRARMHACYSAVDPPAPQMYGGRVALVPDPRRSTTLAGVVPTIKRRWLPGNWAAPAGAYGLYTIYERQTLDFVIPAGTFTLQFEGQVWSFSPGPSPLVSLVIAIDGTPVVTYSATGWPWSDPDSRPVLFGSPHVATTPGGVLTLVNAGAFDQLASGMLRVIPS